MSSDETTGRPPEPLSDDALAGLGDGDIIRLGSRELLPGKRGGRPLTARFEIEVATGKRGEIADLAQTAAIRDVLQWFASRRPSEDENPDASPRG
jgi:hypothetical protein